MTRAILTCSPLFHEPALNEVRRTHPELTITDAPIFPGLILVKANTSFRRLTQPWRHRLPIYLHHIFPVNEIIDLGNDDLRPLIGAMGRIAPSGVPIQVRSMAEWGSAFSEIGIRRALGDIAPARREAATGNVVSVVVVPNGTGARAYVGVSMAEQNISPWAGGVIPAGECVPNRAGYKLLEAMASFGLRLPRGGYALDLGAAPGAWSTLLRRRGMHVTAVAPAPLYPWLALDPGVTHQAVLAEEYLLSCDTPFDLIVNDMKLDGQDSARVMVGYAGHLRPGGIALMTLKLRQENRLRVMDHAMRLLRKAYRIERVRQLVSNGHEVTLLLVRR
jgi:23S rRNA (cytidine2498-2'-O)-methyltransferase